jgi:hypothetical protein
MVSAVSWDVIIGAGIALAAQILTAGMTARRERRALLYVDRKAAYTTFAEEIRGYIHAFTDEEALDRFEREHGPAELGSDQWAELHRLMGPVQLFGSRRTATLAEKTLSALSHYANVSRKGPAPWRVLDDLLAQMGRDLGTHGWHRT